MSLASPLRALGSALLMASVMGCSAKLSEADVEQFILTGSPASNEQFKRMRGDSPLSTWPVYDFN